MALLEQALEYYNMGFSIFPCREDKTPALKWLPYQTERAPEEQIREWWKNGSAAPIAIVTGQLSGVVVVDVDDVDIGFENLARYIPADIETPTAKTPTGGYHLFFKCPETELVRNNAKAIPGCDFRGNGGYVIAAPSFCIYEKGGKQIEGFYAWVKERSIKDIALAVLPASYILYINSFIYKSVTSFSEQVSTSQSSQHESVILFDGQRGEGVFHVANSLVKGGCNPNITRQVLELVARNCEPPFPENEIDARIRSAMDRVARKEKNIAAEFREWIKSAPGQFRVSEYQHESAVVSKQDKHALIVECGKLVEQGILERIGVRRGEYRIVDTEVEFMDFVNVSQEGLYDLELPLGIEKKTMIFPKSVIILAGVTGYGKTTFLLNIIRDNMHKYNFYYFNSEISALGLNRKLSYFATPSMVEHWRMKVIPDHKWDHANIQDKVFPNDVNVIDYLEPEGERTYKIHDIVTAIIKKLDKGIAIIATQKRPDIDLSAGGVYSAKAASLYLSLDWCRIKIFKNRYREEDKNPSLIMRDFEVKPGQTISAVSGWYNEQSKKKAEKERVYEKYPSKTREPGDDGFLPEED